MGCKDPEKAVLHTVGEEAGGEIPKSRKVVELQDAVEEVESCSACYGYLIPALEMLKEDGLFERLDEKISIGQGFREKQELLEWETVQKDFPAILMGVLLQRDRFMSS